MADPLSRQCTDCLQHLPITDFRKNGKSLGGYLRRCKVCALERERLWWESMPPEEREQRKGKYSKANADYRARIPDKIKADKAEWYRQNKDQHKERGCRWRRENPERLRELSRGWNTNRRNCVKDGITARQQADWSAAQKKVCYWCGCKCASRFHIDHYVPLSKGGKHEVRNLVIACAPCNLKKNAKDPLVFAREVGRLL